MNISFGEKLLKNIEKKRSWAYSSSPNKMGWKKKYKIFLVIESARSKIKIKNNNLSITLLQSIQFQETIVSPLYVKESTFLTIIKATFFFFYSISGSRLHEKNFIDRVKLKIVSLEHFSHITGKPHLPMEIERYITSTTGIL